MTKTTAVVLTVLGAVLFMGAGALSQNVIRTYAEGALSLAALLLAGGVALLLLIFGVFSGYLYAGPAKRRNLDLQRIDKFRRALEFERSQRSRLEHDLYHCRQALVGIEDQLTSATLALESRRAAGEEESGKNLEEMEKLAREHQKLADALSKRKERIADLQAELSIAQAEAERAKREAEEIKMSLSPGSPVAQNLLLEGPSVSDVLRETLALDGIRVALLADDFGLVIEAAGHELPPESLAAISSLIAHLGPRVRDVLPIGRVATVTLGDDQGLVLETRYFDLFGTRCAVAIARDEAVSYPGLTERLTQAVKAKMGE